MIICLNIGNTQIYGGVFIDEQLKLQFRHSIHPGITSDQLGLFLKQVLRENLLEPQLVTAIACCSVTPFIDYPLHSACIKYFNLQPFILQPGIKTGLKIKYNNPLEVGADRIANAIAAISLFPQQNSIIIDFGLTATVLCAINKQHDYLGGSILPGLPLAMNALQQQGAKLPAVPIIRPTAVVGRSTVHSIQSGLFYGQLGAVREISNRIQQEMFTNDNAHILATGGLAHLFAQESLFTHIIPHLSLQGLLFALKKNNNSISSPLKRSASDFIGQ